MSVYVFLECTSSFIRSINSWTSLSSLISHPAPSSRAWSSPLEQVAGGFSSFVCITSCFIGLICSFPLGEDNGTRFFHFSIVWYSGLIVAPAFFYFLFCFGVTMEFLSYLFSKKKQRSGINSGGKSLVRQSCCHNANNIYNTRDRWCALLL